ncbi:MAG: hypothetical protein WCG52_10935 [bacterium]
MSAPAPVFDLNLIGWELFQDALGVALRDVCHPRNSRDGRECPPFRIGVGRDGKHESPCRPGGLG